MNPGFQIPREKKMESKDRVDVSSFLIFEASGDSEQLGSDPGMAGFDHGMDVDQDDAESCCSCDSSENVIRVDEFDAFDDYSEVAEAEEEEEEEDDRDDDQAWSSKPVGLQRYAFGAMPGDRKSSVLADSTDGESNEMEKSRLFWEACLAS